MLTEKQRQVLTYIEASFADIGRAPTIREIAANFDICIGTVQKYIKVLAGKGAITYNSRISRGIALPGRSSWHSVPVLGRVPAGNPVPPLEDIEGHVHLGTDVAGAQDCFALKVKGDSMIGDGIFDGDTIVVRRQDVAEDGEIVVALAGGEATVKRFRRRNGSVFLEASNPHYKPITAAPIEIVGKVVYLTRKI